MDNDVDMIAVTSECFVDRVVYDLVNEVVQAAWPGGSDVHTGTLPDSFEALENLDLTGIVFFGFSHALLAFGLGWKPDPLIYTFVREKFRRICEYASMRICDKSGAAHYSFIWKRILSIRPFALPTLTCRMISRSIILSSFIQALDRTPITSTPCET